MIYVCIPTQDNARTIGLLLWKIRQVFGEATREYQLLVADDASGDETGALLEKYGKALPLTVFRSQERRGHARTLESVLRQSLRLTDRPRRDCAITLPADFGVSPAVLPDLVRRFESGADLVIAEAPGGGGSLLQRLVRHSAGWLLRPGLRVPGVHDLLSGVCAIRLMTLRRALHEQNDGVLVTQGACAGAELIARAAVEARQIAVVDIAREHLHPTAGPHGHSLSLALQLFRAGRRLQIPEPAAPIQRVA
jgi:glycosyltransferase involved in cell wall biosynthesis